MKKQTFVIGERLPSRNEMQNISRTNKYMVNAQKQVLQHNIQRYVHYYGVQPVTNPCIVVCRFQESNKRRDTDNVQSSVKYILDALVTGGIIQNDSPKYVVGSPTFTAYGQLPRVVVTIIEDESHEFLRLLLRSAEEIITGV